MRGRTRPGCALGLLNFERDPPNTTGMNITKVVRLFGAGRDHGTPVPYCTYLVHVEKDAVMGGYCRIVVPTSQDGRFLNGDGQGGLRLVDCGSETEAFERALAELAAQHPGLDVSVEPSSEAPDVRSS